MAIIQATTSDITRGKLRRALAAVRDGRTVGKHGKPELWSVEMNHKMMNWIDEKLNKGEKITYKVFQKQV